MKAAEPLGNVNTNGGAAGSTLSGKGMTMPRLADILSGIVGRPVKDETTLDGAYDIELKYSLEMAAPEAGAPAKESPSAYPSLFTAFPVYGIEGTGIAAHRKERNGSGVGGGEGSAAGGKLSFFPEGAKSLRRFRGGSGRSTF